MGIADWAIELARLQYPDLYDIHVDGVEWDGPEINVAVSGKLPVDLVVIEIELVPIDPEPEN